MKTLEEKKARHSELIEGKIIIICDYEKVYHVINDNKIKELKAVFERVFDDYKRKDVTNYLAIDLLEMIAENSNDFTSDIASKMTKNQFNASEKQSWCLAYQIMNNKNVYLQSIIEKWDDVTANAKVNEIETTESIEMSRLNFEIFTETLKQ